MQTTNHFWPLAAIACLALGGAGRAQTPTQLGGTRWAGCTHWILRLTPRQSPCSGFPS